MAKERGSSYVESCLSPPRVRDPARGPGLTAYGAGVGNFSERVLVSSRTSTRGKILCWQVLRAASEHGVNLYHWK